MFLKKWIKIAIYEDISQRSASKNWPLRFSMELCSGQFFVKSWDVWHIFSSKLVETYIFRWTTQILITSSVNFVRISHADRYEVKFSHDQCGKRVKIIRSETRPNDKYERLMTLKNLVILKYYALWTIFPKYYPKYINIIRFIAGRKYGKFRNLL